VRGGSVVGGQHRGLRDTLLPGLTDSVRLVIGWAPGLVSDDLQTREAGTCIRWVKR